MSFLTSFCDFPQNEQRSVSSLLLTIVRGTPSFETGRGYLTVEADERAPECCSLNSVLRPIRGAQSPRLLNHIPSPARRTNNDHARRRAQSVPCLVQYVLRESVKLIRECG